MVTLMRFNIFLVFVIMFTYIFINIFTSLTNKDYKKINYCINVGFFMSVILILSLTLFPVTTEFYTDPRINLVPFSTITSFLNYGSYTDILANIVGNVIMFIPFGFFSYLKFRNNLFSSMIRVLFLTVLVESCQLFLAMRFTDIDDIILNFIGGVVGIITAKIIVYLIRSTEVV